MTEELKKSTILPLETHLFVPEDDFNDLLLQISDIVFHLIDIIPVATNQL